MLIYLVLLLNVCVCDISKYLTDFDFREEVCSMKYMSVCAKHDIEFGQGWSLCLCVCVLDGCYPLLMPPDLAVGTHTGSCGHVMHATCWQK